MSTNMANLVVKLTTDNKGLNRGFKGATSSMKGFVGKALTIAAPLAAAFGAKAALDAARVQIQAEKKLAAVLKSTGNAAGFTAGEIKAYAGELQNATNFGDEETLNAAAKLATFNKITGETFKETLSLAQDLAAVFDGDLSGASMQLGKALQDPSKGLSALSRSGVSFTTAQKEMIQTLQQSGDMLGAQKIILAEVRNQVGGSARDMADQITQAKNSIGDLSESLGMLLAPTVGGLAKGFADLITESVGGQEKFKELGETIADDVVPALLSLAETVRNAFPEDFISDWSRGVGVLTGGTDRQLEKARGQGLDLDLALAAQRRIKEGRGTDDDRMLVARTRDRAGRATDEDKALLNPADNDFLVDGIASLAKAPQAGLSMLGGHLETFAGKIAEAAPKVQKAFDDIAEKNREFAASLFEQTRTPEERFEAQKAKLSAAFLRGDIDEDLLRRGLDQASDPLKNDSEISQSVPLDAIEVGSDAAFDMIVRAMTGSTDDKGTDRMIAQNEEIISQLRQIKQGNSIPVYGAS